MEEIVKHSYEAPAATVFSVVQSRALCLSGYGTEGVGTRGTGYSDDYFD